MNYTLINRQTNHPTHCTKVTIEGFDYYVSDEESGGYGLVNSEVISNCNQNKIIATTDVNYEDLIPQVTKNYLEKVAMDILKPKWDHLYISGYPTRPFPSSYQNEVNLVIRGLSEFYEPEDNVVYYESIPKPYEYNHDVPLHRFKPLMKKIGGKIIAVTQMYFYDVFVFKTQEEVDKVPLKFRESCYILNEKDFNDMVKEYEEEYNTKVLIHRI